jgi:sugar/nucleoside kinase (ribokinase family)
LSPDDIDERVIVSSKVIYLEGYLYDPPQAKAAFIKAAKVAKKAGRMVSFSLSDQFCVDRHRAEFLDFVNNYVDVLFANEDEINSLYQVDSFEEALENVRGACNIAAVTRGSRGSVIVSGEKTHFLVAEKVRDIIDTTGAGDSYAAGFLYGLTQGKDLEMCGRMGGILAADIIGDYGARSKNDLKVVLDASLRD